MPNMSKKRSNSGSRNYEVGYGRPPRQYRFKRGGCANPSGINKKPARAIAPDLKNSLEGALKERVTIRHGNQCRTVTQAAAGCSELVRQFAKGDARGRRDLILLCEKLGIELIDRAVLQSALDDVLPSEDETLLAEFVKRHGGQYPLQADVVPTNPNDAEPNTDAKLLTASSENSLNSQIVQTEEKIS
jgi:hypothetical protein